ncbi:nitroreductase [Hirschia baltica]|uniref:Nitroreductase n=1 Tax=Hirschia baltica (strain ATCC 49814 / DSM 5838 / IFAM 1418) TaxID=582402 RepID=C6XQX2_HIRBI|nr:nitroreductase [Hirschia baltica]ACT60503.1 nitroreductase [Hirschia baltica ATCC 49814]
MEFDELIRSRRSIRGFKNMPVPKDVIIDIMEVARYAPSSMNTQPWNVYAISGDILDKIREGNSSQMLAGVPPKRDFPIKEAYEGDHRQRQIDVAIQLFEAMGIERHDKERRQDWVMRGFRQFDAPVSLALTYDKYLEPAAISQFDLGAFSHAIVLAAWERGIGAVINGQGIMQSEVVHKHAGIPDNQAIMTCIALGYPDYDFPANSVKSTRADVDTFLNFVGFGSDSE